MSKKSSGYAYLLCQVYILDRMDDFDAIGHRFLEGLSSQDQAHASCTFVDDGRSDSLTEIVLSGCTPGVDEPHTPHETIGYLVPGQIDGMV